MDMGQHKKVTYRNTSKEKETRQKRNSFWGDEQMNILKKMKENFEKNEK